MFGHRLDSMILEAFSNLIDSVILSAGCSHGARSAAGRAASAVVPGSQGQRPGQSKLQRRRVEKEGLAPKAPYAGVPGRSFTLVLPYSVMATSERRVEHRQVVVSKSLINAVQSRT